MNVGSSSTLQSVPNKMGRTYPTLAQRILARLQTLKCPEKVPAILGGNSFSFATTLYEAKGPEAERALLFWVAPHIRAKAYTALVRHLKRGGFFQEAALFAHRAYEQEPRPFRLKFLALSLDDADEVLKASTLVKQLPVDISMNLTDMIQALHIWTDAARELASETIPPELLTPRMFVVQYNVPKNEAAFECVTFGRGNVKLWIGQCEIPFLRVKTVCTNHGRSTSIIRKRLWISLSAHQSSTQLTITIDEQLAKIVLQQVLHTGVTIDSIRSVLSPPTVHDASSPYTNCWLFIDRDSNADDNAEHLYRYVKKHHPEINAWFLLRDNSHDWTRLSEEGFCLIPWQSSAHKEALLCCSKVISSHSNSDVLRIDGKILNTKPYIFLQHGVIKDNLSAFLNHKRIDLFVTSTKDEWASICGKKSKYIFDEQVVQCLGLPRHDALLVNDVPCERQILIMPTWRRYLAGSSISGHTRTINPDFNSSNFLKTWASFLNSKRLQVLTTEYNYKVVFFPHAVMQPYVLEFHVPDYIHCITHAQSGIQRLFKSSALMVTDYSSVAFEMAYLGRPVIYYQFNEESFFSGRTAQWGKGYFDYHTHGFGPVVTKESALLEVLEGQLQRQATP